MSTYFSVRSVTAVVSHTPTLKDWDGLVHPLTTVEIEEAIQDPVWQAFRASLKGQPIETRFHRLTAWLDDHRVPTAYHYQRAQTQVANYVNALKRAGMVK